MNNRILRVNELIKEQLSKIIIKEVDLSNGELITIIDVDTSKDLRYAKVLVSILPDSKTGTSFTKLIKKIHIIQRVLNEKLSMKPVPRIRFELDTGGKHYSEIEQLIQKIEGDTYQ